ncbi:MAG TPA: ATP-binding protein [Candidatus Dormibacteraeota bacterium]|nr:ATP-binding protein [Candidatus Dormibacteraeota bacterium]
MNADLWRQDRRLRRAFPYLTGLAGVVAITAAVGVLRPVLELPSLAVAYLLLVLWLGARWGWPPAMATAVLGFCAYDWFFVPPLGTLWISAPHQLLDLVILLAAALLGGRLVSTLARQRAGAAASAREWEILNEVAVAALQEPEGGSALSLLCERAVEPGGLRSLTLLAETPDGLEVVAGAPLTAAELRQARWAAQNRQNLGARLSRGRLELLRTIPARPEPRCVVLTGGVAVLWLRNEREEPGPRERHLLAGLLGLAGLLLDRRRAAAASERARLLEVSDRLKSAVLSSLSHELKTPIASLRAGLTTLAMPEAGLPAAQRDLVAGLDGQAARLDHLVGDLLSMARLEAEIGLELAPQRLEDVLGTAMHTLGRLLEPFEVRVDLPPEIPPVLADELQLGRALRNLLENAVEWTRPGDRIEVGARAEEETVRVWVANQGPAIPPGDLERIFDTFWTRRRQGSGLGLAIVRRVIDAHGGSIQVDNQRDGPRFTLTLRRAKVSPEQLEEAQRSADVS